MALGVSDRSLVFVKVANLIAYKGHLDLLSALADTAAALPNDWTLLLVGRDDGMGPEIASAARHLGLDKNIRVMGARTDIAEILRAADIGLLVSHEEGFPNVVVEYMAAGLPVIATGVGGTPEAISGGETGIVVPKESRDDLAAALLRLSGDERLRQNMGEAGRRRAAKLFDLESCAEAYDRLYRALLARNGRNGPSSKG
jgi:glycosyltransferase involved in cell wall biosynthesis